MKDISRQDFVPINWTPEGLREMREALELTQREMAAIVGVSKGTISHIECGYISNPLTLLGYGMALERGFAMQNGYVPAYRKIGTNRFKEII